MTTTNQLPVADQNANTERVNRAGYVLNKYIRLTHCDDGDALGDLLADLMHLADDTNQCFAKALDRARDHYQAEPTEGE